MRIQLALLVLLFFPAGQLAQASPAKSAQPLRPAATSAVRAPVLTPVAPSVLTQGKIYRAPASHDINEAIDITGQSRNLSMGLMFQRDKDKVSFGLPRTSYKDKITGSQINY